MIYFVQDNDGGPIKIGHTNQLTYRLKQLENTYQRPLNILATMPGGAAEEAAIHVRFADLRFGRTEQFRPTPELYEFMGRADITMEVPTGLGAMPAKRSVRRGHVINVRLTAMDLERLESIQAHFNLTSINSAIRLAVSMAYHKIREEEEARASR